jgi:hypothetical protein
VIPLVPEAVAILKNIRKGPNGEYILSSTEGAKPIRGIGKFYRTRLRREIIACIGSALSSPFTSHDLRRYVPFLTMSGNSRKPLILRRVLRAQ